MGPKGPKFGQKHGANFIILSLSKVRPREWGDDFMTGALGLGGCRHGLPARSPEPGRWQLDPPAPGPHPPSRGILGLGSRVSGTLS